MICTLWVQVYQRIGRIHGMLEQCVRDVECGCNRNINGSMEYQAINSIVYLGYCLMLIVHVVLESASLVTRRLSNCYFVSKKGF